MRGDYTSICQALTAAAKGSGTGCGPETNTTCLSKGESTDDDGDFRVCGK